jgi:hypothetical protein
VANQQSPFGLRVRDDLLQHGHAAAVADDVRVHGQQEGTAFLEAPSNSARKISSTPEGGV